MASGEDGSDQKGVEPVFGGPGAGELQISEESSSPHVRNDELSRSRSPAGELSADVTPDETRIKLCKQSVHACARFGDLEGLQKHLDQRPISVGEQDPQGLTPLHFAASYGEVRAMDILLAAKADPQVQCHEGWIPLFVAARNGYIDCVSTLVKAKADVNATGAGKETALHNAARAEGAEATEWLLAAGAILDQVDADGWTPLHYATRFNNPDALKLNPSSILVDKSLLRCAAPEP
jgi:ankyrin repeat protein